MALPDRAEQADVAALEDLVGVAGGTVGGTVRIGNQLVDAGDKQLVDELGSQLEGRATGRHHPRRREPATSGSARCIARAVGTDTAAAPPSTAPATSILAGLEHHRA